MNGGKGFIAGGNPYGYIRPKIDPETGEKKIRKWHTHQIDPDQAKVVKEMFQMYADGMRPRAIAAPCETSIAARIWYASEMAISRDWRSSNATNSNDATIAATPINSATSRQQDGFITFPGSLHSGLLA